MKCRLPIRIGGGGGSAAPTPVSVTITGTGNTTYCYAAIGGTNRYGAGTYEVMPGDKITFGVYGRSSSYYGRVTIDGQQVLNVTNQSTQTYEWTVPDDISAISMQMTYTSSSYSRNGRIVVTTTKKPTGGGGGGASEYAVTLVNSSETDNAAVANMDTMEAYSTDGTYAIAAGATLLVLAPGQLDTDVASTKITYNGTTVAQGESQISLGVYPFAAYEFALKENIRVTFTKHTSPSMSSKHYYTAAIVSA